jgi:hypothetical protein
LAASSGAEDEHPSIATASVPTAAMTATARLASTTWTFCVAEGLSRQRSPLEGATIGGSSS